MFNKAKDTHRRPAAIRPFSSAATRDSWENLVSTINYAKSLNPLKVVDWDAPYWSFPDRSRASSAGDGGLWFTISKATRSGGKDPFPEAWMNFAKAVICIYEKESKGNYAASQFQTLIRALSLIYQVQMRDRGVADPTILTPWDLDRALEMAVPIMGPGIKNIGSKLAIVARMVTRHGIVTTPVPWSNPIKSAHKHDRLGEEADERREKFMPVPAALDALAEISRRTDLHDRDLILQRAADLLVCCGFRVNEMLTMPANCVVEEDLLDDDGKPMQDRFGQPAKALGLRYWPEKEGIRETQVKPVPTVAREVVLRAIQDVERICRPYRELAEYQRANPGRTLLGEPWDSMAPTAKLNRFEIGCALRLRRGDSSDANRLRNQVTQYLRGTTAPIPVYGQRQDVHVLKRDLETHLVGRSMSGDVLRREEISQDLSKCLFVIPHRFMHSYHEAGIPGTVQLVTDAMLDVYLGGIATQPSIFARLGYLDEAGDPLKMETHNPRHMLNTIAHEGGLSEHEIARFSGRADISHNPEYDHRSPVQRAKDLRGMMLNGGSVGPTADAASRIRDPRRRAEFVSSTTSTAHVTALGVCVHPWDVLPCQKHAACEGCNKLRIVKGRGRPSAAEQLKTTLELVAIAEEAMSEGDWGADRWFDAHQRAVERLRRIVAVHDGDLPDGTIVEIPLAAEPIGAPVGRRLGTR